MIPIKSSEITPESVYHDRRKFMKGVGLAALGGLAVAACAPAVAQPTAAPAAATTGGTIAPAAPAASGAMTDELGDPVNTFEEITNFNNFYEFTTDKEKVAGMATDFPTRPWTVEIGGLVNNPAIFSIEDILSRFDREERIYRLRCVEGWSMVIPWLGFQLSTLLELVEPKSNAKYVRFETLLDPEVMPGQRSNWFDWPYVEGLRIDEAMNPLALIATGLYGKDLLPQNGAPLRLVTPWKYGFKSIKSIVKIDLVEEQPTSLWMAAAPREYGFYANVNPEVQHPRWSQRTERRIGETKRRETLPFNGYGDEVAYLYEGMNLAAYY
ncbi:MAG: protein-methionine-sulfoxide reductase catalytic subunit MsrP [Anaerolineae bacterium]|nr:protein-methionine-sulfoxide reductase catalytic subunit MsrP [Anaerolineae bacterium]MCB0237355.1 protein-methionine-sulfoxide reductase catalytic subunit MsrP [Anaerolineae bacterium]MCB9141222.1 protein-methionine-sulfoxide reductase catalytic subunit MsrP [Anaerolineales bacterium]MCO5245720.1 protein-methionine-sulfoxide reductase catalytic subunit MsrP [Anaerolineae bacterium]